MKEFIHSNEVCDTKEEEVTSPTKDVDVEILACDLISSAYFIKADGEGLFLNTRLNTWCAEIIIKKDGFIRMKNLHGEIEINKDIKEKLRHFLIKHIKETFSAKEAFVSHGIINHNVGERTFRDDILEKILIWMREISSEEFKLGVSTLIEKILLEKLELKDTLIFLLNKAIAGNFYAKALSPFFGLGYETGFNDMETSPCCCYLIGGNND